MQNHRIAGEPSAHAPRGSVSGLGVCDVWRLELSEVQWTWLVDELEDLRGPLEEALQRAWATQSVDRSDAVADEVSAREYELRLVRMMRAQLPAHGHGDGAVFLGPVELVRELVGGTLRNVVGSLSELVDAQHVSDREAHARLLQTAEAAQAWARTFVECQELESFSFDPAADPVRLG